MDGDGASEIVCNNLAAPTNDIEVRKWNGTALSAPTTWKASWCDGQITPGDFSGDGKTDLFCGATSALGAAGSVGVQADLLNSVTNSLGGSTQVSYGSSTAYLNTNAPPAKNVVTSLTTRDGRGGQSTTGYSYSGALMDRVERKFLGFRYIKETLPCITGETLCPYVETWLQQDLASAGKPSQIDRKDGAGRVLSSQTFGYTTNGTTVPRTSLLTSQTTYTYDGSGTTCLSWPCAYGKRVYATFAYDAYGNSTKAILYGDQDAAGDETTTMLTYAPNTTAYIVGKLALKQIFSGTTTAGAKLSETKLYYDGASSYTTAPTQGYATASYAWLDRESRYVGRSFVYDAYGNLTSASDPTSRSVSTTYDATYHLFPISVTNAASETVSTAWDAICAVPLSTTDLNSQTTSFQTDALCRPTRTDLPLGAFQITSYLNVGTPATQYVKVQTPSATPSDGTGNDYAISYLDGYGRSYRTAKKGPAAGQGIYQDVSFNARGGTATATAPYYAGGTTYTTAFEYDSFDRPTRTLLPDGHDVRQSYGLASVTGYDPHGHQATTSFDAYGRTAQTQQWLSGSPVPTSYSYDLLGRRTGLTDAAGNRWSWQFDSLGRSYAKSDPDAGAWSYSFDDAGRPTSQTDAKSQTTSITYDLAGRLAAKTSPVGTTTFTRSQARTGYFNAGRVTTVTSPSDTLKTDYDAEGRAARITRTLDGVDYVAQRRYDSVGRLLGITYPDGDMVGTTASPLTYDAAGRLSGIPGIVTSVVYDASGRPITQSDANGAVTNRVYSAERGFLTDIQSVVGAATIQNFHYTADAAGMLESVTSPFSNETWSYQYDDLHHMTQATDQDNPSASQSFSYDALGRITYNSRLGSYSYPVDGSARPHAPSTAGVNSYGYDANGNLSSGAGRTLGWDAEDRVTQVIVGTTTTAFTYDDGGERLKKVSGSTTSLYPMGDDYEVTNGVVTKYISAGGLGVVAKRVGAATYWLHTERLGSIEAITDAAGAIVQRKTYRPYGDKLADSTSHVESRGWIDQRQDETGLTYLHARYYDPQLGVFLRPDPAGADLNSYRYSANDPVNRLDPTGLSWRCVRVRVTQGERTLFDGGYDCDWVDDPNPDEGIFINPYKGPGPGNHGPQNGPQHPRGGRGGVTPRTPRGVPPCTPGVNCPGPPPCTPGVDCPATPPCTPGVDCPAPPPCHPGSPEAECSAGVVVASTDVEVVANAPPPLTPPANLPGYDDLNVSAGSGIGVTGGIMTDAAETCGYLGGGLMTPGVSPSFTGSPSTITRGLNIGLQVNFGFAFQLGHNGSGWFWEFGAGLPPGASLTAHYVICPR